MNGQQGGRRCGRDRHTREGFFHSCELVSVCAGGDVLALGLVSSARTREGGDGWALAG
jgi:hypothetical protein